LLTPWLEPWIDSWRQNNDASRMSRDRMAYMGQHVLHGADGFGGVIDRGANRSMDGRIGLVKLVCLCVAYSEIRPGPEECILGVGVNHQRGAVP